MIPQRADMMTPFYVMEILEKAEKMERAGESVIHLEIGEPDFPTPACIREPASGPSRKGRPATPTVWAFGNYEKRSVDSIMLAMGSRSIQTRSS